MFRTLFAVCLIIFFTNCNNEEDQNSIDEELIRTFDLSNKAVKQSTQIHYENFYKNCSDARFSEHSMRWKPKVDSIKFLSDSLVIFIDRLMKPFERAIESNSNEKPDLANSNDIKKLYENIMRYESLVLNIKDEIRLIFGKRKSKISNNIDTIFNSFARKYFKNKSAYKQLLFLNKFKNDIYTFENDIITYCNGVTTPIIHTYNAFSVIIVQSSNIVKKGDIIEITAGVGEFSIAATPKIVIDNKVSPINESAFTTYKLKAQNKAGYYTVPVRITYTKSDGMMESKNYTIGYTVKD